MKARTALGGGGGEKLSEPGSELSLGKKNDKGFGAG